MNFRTLFAGSALSAIAFASCGDGGGNTSSASSADSTAPAPRVMPSLSPVSASPEFPDSKIGIATVKAEKVGKDSAKVSFMFDVKNYQLKMQTADSATKQCNNSAQGQHIHFILDNMPYKALYEPKNEVTLANGTEHYLMAFLSRSYHESIKSAGAALVYHFRISADGKLEKLDEPKTPMVFYSRPKGDYLGKDTANVLLDYYVWNASLAPDGYKVNATVLTEKGGMTDSTKFTFDKWEPKFITNLPTGKNKVILTLTDKNGIAVEGPCTNVAREFTLTAQEPMK
ncbi:MAG: hypothetical protein IAE95_11525 [Chitinophagaceae bacterium]|nr:hypothetical protein [Chitinophagaceae bacterium]